MEETKNKTEAEEQKDAELRKILQAKLKKKTVEVELGDVSKWEKVSPLDLIVAKKIGLDLDQDAVKRLNEDPDGLYSLIVTSYFKKEAEKAGKTELREKLSQLMRDRSISAKEIGFYASKALTDNFTDQELEKAWNNLKKAIFSERSKDYREELAMEKRRQMSSLRERGVLRKVVAIAIAAATLVSAGAATTSYYWAKAAKEDYYQKVNEDYRKKVQELEKKFGINTSTQTTPQQTGINIRKVSEDALKTTYASPLINDGVAQNTLTNILIMEEVADDPVQTTANLKNKLKALEEFSQKNKGTLQAFDADLKITSLYYLNQEIFPDVSYEAEVFDFIKKYANNQELTTDHLIEFTNRVFVIESTKPKTDSSPLGGTFEANYATLAWFNKTLSLIKGAQATADLSYIKGNILTGNPNIIDFAEKLNNKLDTRLAVILPTTEKSLDEIVESYQNSEYGGRDNVVRGLFAEGKLLVNGLPNSTNTPLTEEKLRLAVESLEGANYYISLDGSARFLNIQGDLFFTLGQAYERLGMVGKAQDFYTKALGFEGYKEAATTALKNLKVGYR